MCVVQDQNRKRYDADVLTKIVVYSGIGLWATLILPWGFQYVGWSV